MRPGEAGDRRATSVAARSPGRGPTRGAQQLVARGRAAPRPLCGSRQRRAAPVGARRAASAASRRPSSVVPPRLVRPSGRHASSGAQQPSSIRRPSCTRPRRVGHGAATVVDTVAAVDVAVVIPNFNGARWLPGVLDSVAAQTVAPAEVVVVDDGSTDDSLALLAERFPDVRVVALPANGGFARTANAGLAAVGSRSRRAAQHGRRARARLARAGGRGARGRAPCGRRRHQDGRPRRPVAPLRRRRRAPARRRLRAARPLRARHGRYDAPGEVFSACAGAALYRREAVLAVGGFDERLGTYLEDVDLGLRLRLAAWRCRWEPRAVARHAGGGSSGGLRHGPGAWVERNTLLLVARSFPARWLPLVALPPARLGLARRPRRRAARPPGGRAVALPLLPAFLRERRALRGGRRAGDRGGRAAAAGPRPRAGGHPSRHAR